MIDEKFQKVFFAFKYYKKQIRRTPEALLLGLSLIGGGLGGFIGMLLFRHKTKHWYFHAVNIIGLIWQIALAAYLYVAFV